MGPNKKGGIASRKRRDAGGILVALLFLSLFTIRCDDGGEGPVHITVIRPAWSPTNNYIAVFKYEFRSRDPETGCNSSQVTDEPAIPVYAVTLADTAGRFLADLGTAMYPGEVRWSPNGQSVAFTQLVRTNAAGLTIAAIGGGSIPVPALIEAVDVAWSPLGNRIVAAGKMIGDSLNHLYAVNADGTNLRELNPAITGDVSSVRWSTQDRIAIIYHQDYRGYLGLVNGDGSNFMVVDSIGLVFGLIDWSPDGSKLIHTAAAAPYKLFSVDPVTFQRTELAEGEFFTFISFAPTGGLVGFTNASGFYVVDSSGTNQRFIGPNISSPSWSPDGTEVVYASGEKLAFQQIR